MCVTGYMKHRDTKPLPIHSLNDLSKSLNILITTVFIFVFFFFGGRGGKRGEGEIFCGQLYNGIF